MRDDFSPATKLLLAKRVGHRCSNPECRRPTSGPQSDRTKAINLGVAAHMTAASRLGPRYADALSTRERLSAENGIWLCQTCARLIDSDSHRYSVETLVSWKRSAERLALESLESPPVQISVAMTSFALDGEVCSFLEHRLDQAKPPWPEDIPYGRVTYRPGGRIEEYGRTFGSHGEASAYGDQLLSRYNHPSFTSEAMHQLYCEAVEPGFSEKANYPVFYAALSNFSETHVVLADLISIVYQVEPLAATGASHILAPIHTYEVRLASTAGSYRVAMVPALKIEAGDAAAIRIAVRPMGDRVGGYAWLIRFVLASRAGVQAESPAVSLVM